MTYDAARDVPHSGVGAVLVCHRGHLCPDGRAGSRSGASERDAGHRPGAGVFVADHGDRRAACRRGAGIQLGHRSCHLGGLPRGAVAARSSWRARGSDSPDGPLPRNSGGHPEARSNAALRCSRVRGARARHVTALVLGAVERGSGRSAAGAGGLRCTLARAADPLGDGSLGSSRSTHGHPHACLGGESAARGERDPAGSRRADGSGRRHPDRRSARPPIRNGDRSWPACPRPVRAVGSRSHVGGRARDAYRGDLSLSLDPRSPYTRRLVRISGVRSCRGSTFALQRQPRNAWAREPHRSVPSSTAWPPRKRFGSISRHPTSTGCSSRLPSSNSKSGMDAFTIWRGLFQGSGTGPAIRASASISVRSDCTSSSRDGPTMQASLSSAASS